MKAYEGLFIFEQNLKDEALEKVLDGVREEITGQGGDITHTDVIGRQVFARPMDKRRAGVYVRIYFDLSPSRVSELLARYRLNPDVFRVQVYIADRVPGEEAAAEAAAETVEATENS